MPKQFARTALVLVGVVATVAACSSGSTGGGSTSSGSGAAFADKPYSGQDEKHFVTLADPTASGKKFTLGFLNAYAALPSLLAEQQAACDEATKLGGTCITKDANLSVQTQVSQMSELLSQGVTAISMEPLDPGALAPSLAQAAAQHVPVTSADTPPDITQPATSDVSTNVSQGLDYAAWATMTAVAKQMPGVHFAVMGTASPNPLLKFLISRCTYWAEQQGLTFDGEVDATADTPTAWSTAGGAIGQKYRNAKVLVSYNDASALAAASTVRAAGRTDLVVADANGYTARAKAALQSGTMVASYAVPWDQKGRAQAIEAYEAATGGTVTPIVGIKGVVVTKSNAASVSTIG